MCEHVFVFICAHIQQCVFIFIYVYVHVYLYSPTYVCVNMYLSSSVHTYLYSTMHTYMCICVHLCIYTSDSVFHISVVCLFDIQPYIHELGVGYVYAVVCVCVCVYMNVCCSVCVRERML